MAKVFKSCSVNGCKRNAHYTAGGTAGMCRAHRKRLRKYGSPYAGPTEVGEVFAYFSEVVLTYTGDDCLVWPYCRSRGYGQISIGGRMRLVHRLLCEIRNGPPSNPRYEAAHECGNGKLGCVNPGHVVWKTSAENGKDKVRHGHSARAERHPMAKLTLADVSKIRDLKGRATVADIAQRFGVSKSQIYRIHQGKYWS